MENKEPTEKVCEKCGTGIVGAWTNHGFVYRCPSIQCPVNEVPFSYIREKV